MERSPKEQQRIDELHERGKPVFLNNKGHLCFRQRYPDFPIYISVISNLIAIIAGITLLVLKLWL